MQQGPIASAIRKQGERGMNADTQITFFSIQFRGDGIANSYATSSHLSWSNMETLMDRLRGLSSR